MKPAVKDGNIKLPYLETPPEIEFKMFLLNIQKQRNLFLKI